MRLMERSELLMSLTPQDLRAIRHADQLVFRHGTPRHVGGLREDWLECGLDGLHSPTGYEQVHAVTLEPAVITIYHRDPGPGGQPGHPLEGVALGDTCGCIAVYPRYSREHQTWIAALRPGDRLTTWFLVGNNNAYLNDAGLSQDEAWLVIARPGAKYDARYYLDSRISPAFSSARMIQPVTPPAVTAG
jgi:hypothetical protein